MKKMYSIFLIMCTVPANAMLHLKPRINTISLKNNKELRQKALVKTTVPKRHFMDALKPLLIINQKQCAVIERFGKYNRTLRSGIHFKWPLIEIPRNIYWTSNNRLDLREQLHDLPKQKVITEDNVEMTIGALIYYKIEEQTPERAIYEIQNLPFALEKLAQTTLRNIIGSMHFDKTLTARDQINKTLCSTLDGATDKWGVTVTRVELQEITPPVDILAAMEKQMTAERVRRAVVTEAEGKREAAVKQAEGERDASIKRAEGKRQSLLLEASGESDAMIKRAEGKQQALILEAEGNAIARTKQAQAEADTIASVKQTAGESAIGYLQSMEYIRTLPKIYDGKDNRLIIIPQDMSSLAGLLTTAQELIKK